MIRGGVKVQKRDIETGETKPQGNATLKGATFTITNLSTHPVLVNEKLYESGQVVLTLKTDKSGAAATAKDAPLRSLPHRRNRSSGWLFKRR